MGFSPAKYTPHTGSTVPGFKSKGRSNKHTRKLPGQKAVLALQQKKKQFISKAAAYSASDYVQPVSDL